MGCSITRTVNSLLNILRSYNCRINDAFKSFEETRKYNDAKLKKGCGVVPDYPDEARYDSSIYTFSLKKTWIFLHFHIALTVLLV